MDADEGPPREGRSALVAAGRGVRAGGQCPSNIDRPLGSPSSARACSFRQPSRHFMSSNQSSTAMTMIFMIGLRGALAAHSRCMGPHTRQGSVRAGLEGCGPMIPNRVLSTTRRARSSRAPSSAARSAAVRRTGRDPGHRLSDTSRRQRRGRRDRHSGSCNTPRRKLPRLLLSQACWKPIGAPRQRAETISPMTQRSPNGPDLNVTTFEGEPANMKLTCCRGFRPRRNSQARRA